MSGHGDHDHARKFDQEEAIAHETDVFKFLKWGHLASFLVILFIFELKRRGYYIIGQGF